MSYTERYARHLSLPEVGPEGQEKLKAARVLVIGAGGLGCPVLMYLCAAGIGTIGVVEFDRISLSNLQRQVLYTTEEIGLPKIKTAAARLKAMTPEVNLMLHEGGLTKENAISILEQYDIVVDGTDNFPTRYLINDAALICGKPVVFGSIYKFEAQISVFNYRQGPSYRCLYPEMPAAGEVPNCSEIGVIGVLPGICGTLQANEVIKIILEKGRVLSGVLLVMDALQAKFHEFQIQRTEAADRRCLEKGYDFDCQMGPQEMTWEEIQEWKNGKQHFLLVDVREKEEYLQKNAGAYHLPLSELESRWTELAEKQMPICIHCQGGVRSKKAIQLLSEKGIKQLINVSGGINVLPKTWK